MRLHAHTNMHLQSYTPTPSNTITCTIHLHTYTSSPHIHERTITHTHAQLHMKSYNLNKNVHKNTHGRPISRKKLITIYYLRSMHKSSPRFLKCVLIVANWEKIRRRLEPEVIASESQTYFISKMFALYFIVYKMALKLVYGNWSKFFTKLTII